MISRHVTSTAALGAALTLALATAATSPASADTHLAAAPDLDRATLVAASASGLPPYDTWISDVTAVTDRASAYLATRLPDPTIKPAIVLDVDNTALETTYTGGITIPATRPVLALARQAKAAGAAVIFVTARPLIIQPETSGNLTDVGYPVDGLYLRGFFDFSSNQAMKTADRTKIEKAGYTIVANIGNNDSDLAGGHAERTFKLPDYGGRLS